MQNTLSQPMQIINWADPKYSKAAYGTLEFWQYRAACYVTNGYQKTMEQTDAVRLVVGQIAFGQHQTNGWTCTWHAAATYFGNKCMCSRCKKDRNEAE